MKRNLKILLMIGLILLTLTGCGGKKDKEKEAEIPETYTIGEESVFALAVYDGVTVVEVGQGDEEEEGEESQNLSYVYEGIKTPGLAMEMYTAQLTAEEVGFAFIDKEHYEIEPPDFRTEEGEVYLARPTQTGDTMMMLTLKWSEEKCVVDVAVVDGGIKEAPPGMELMEAVDHFRSFSPAKLGLQGNSMKDYRIYALDGAVMVDNQVCLQLNVYSSDNTAETNELLGMYLMTSDGRRVYQLDEYRDDIKELKVN